MLKNTHQGVFVLKWKPDFWVNPFKLLFLLTKYCTNKIKNPQSCWFSNQLVYFGSSVVKCEFGQSSVKYPVHAYLRNYKTCTCPGSYLLV